MTAAALFACTTSESRARVEAPTLERLARGWRILQIAPS